MLLAQKVRNKLRALVQSYGPENLKSHLWNSEFSHGRWDCLDETPTDCVYPYIEKYANKGSILDLGCGSGSTGNELAENAYGDYVGIDISDVAIGKAKNRTENNGRGAKTRFFQSDVFSYLPNQQFDVILFRDSIYYVPRVKIKPMLDRYSKYLKHDGVFVVRMWDGDHKHKPIADTIESSFEIVDKHISTEPNAVVIVFRQRSKNG